ncbi:phage tail tape measure protein, TP901 family, core region [Terrisporobacter glycolicus]|nr:phage tail tape measure protein, TP901 family, core region [Terrisporobacter glycolicus]
MSNKRNISIKITANASGLKRALSDANKQIDKLKKSGDKFDKSKFGKNVDRQFKDITKTSKDINKQIKNNTKAFDKLGKIKLNTLIKQFDGISKSTKNNIRTIDKLKSVLNNIKSKSIESVNKVMLSMSKGASTVSKGFGNIKNSINTISSRSISSVSNALSNISSKCSGVLATFSNIKSSIGSISSKSIQSVQNAVSSLVTKCPAVANAFNNIKTSVGNIKTNTFNTLSTTVSNIGSKVQTLSSKFGTLKTTISNATKTSWNNLTGGLSNIMNKISPIISKFTTLKSKISETAKGTFDRLISSTNKLGNEGKDSTTIFTKFANKIKELTGGMLSSFTNKLNGISNSSKSTSNSLTSTIGKFTIFGASATAVSSGVSKISSSLSKANPEILKTGRTMGNYQMILKSLQRENKLFEEGTKNLTKEGKEAYDIWKKYKNSLDELYSSLIKNKTATDSDIAAIEKLKNTANNFESNILGIADSQEKASKSTKSWSNVTKDLSDAWDKFKSGDYKGAFDSLKSASKTAFALMPGYVKAIAGLVVALNALYKAGQKRFFEGLSDIQNTFQPIINSIKSGIQGIKTAFESLTGFRLSLDSFIQVGVNYESTMAQVKAITGTTGKEFDSLKQKARDLGASTRYSATEAGEAMIQMGQQGWSASKILSGVPSVLNLATVGNISLADSAELVTNTMNALGMKVDNEGKNVSHFADVVATASVRSGTSVSQFAEAMINVASTAGVTGASIEDLAVAVGLMGNNFIKSGKAGTSMKTFIANMAKPTKQMRGYIEKYNLEGARQDIVNGRLTEGYKKFATAMNGLSKEQKESIGAALAGKEGMAGFLAIVGKGPKQIEDMDEAMKKSNDVAKHMAETFDATLKGALLNISSGIEEKVLQVFDKIKPTLTGAANAVNDFFESWNKGDLKGGLANIEKQVAKSIPNISRAIQKGVSNIESFINGGSFDSILQIGTDIIDGITKGIDKSVDNGTLLKAINGAISKICDWIIKNGPKIQKSGGKILDAIRDGINNNREKLSKAADTIYSVINTWVSKKKGTISALGLACWDAFIGGIIKGKIDDVKEKLKNLFNPDKEVNHNPNSENKLEASGTDPVSNIKNWWNEITKQDGNVVHAAEVTADKYKETVANKLNDGELSKNAANAINKALDRGEDAKKGAWKITKGYISTLQEGLVNGDIDESTYNTLLKSLNQVDKAKSSASETTKGYLDSLEDGIMNGSIDPSSVDAILSQLTSSESVYKNASETGQKYIDELRQQLLSGQITTEQFNALVFSGTLEDAAKEWTKDGKIKADDVIDAQSFSSVEEIDNLKKALDELKNKYKDINASINDSAKGMANVTRTNLLSCTNITRNQFISMSNIVRSQMTNCSNIAKNQFVGIANIVRNQSQNARNSATTAFISMKKVISTQCMEARTYLVSKFISMATVAGVQAWRARDNATRAFISLAKVVRSQMQNAYSSVTSYMSKIAAATSKSMSMSFKVNKSVTTTNTVRTIAEPVAKPSFLSLMRVSSLPSAKSALLSTNSIATYSASDIGISSLSRAASSVLSQGHSSSNRGQKDNIYLDATFNIDGKQIAKTTAKYMDKELKTINDKDKRKKGRS